MKSSKADPRLTIQGRGTISLNRTAFELLGSPSAVELLYDRDEQVVGLRPAAPATHNAHKVRRSSPAPSGPWLISAMAFAKFYDIDTSKTMRWDVYLDQDGVLCADLTGEGTVVTNNRAHTGIDDR